MTTFVYNAGSTAHRGVWHIAAGELTFQSAPARTVEYESTYWNETQITHYPEIDKEYVDAEVLCSAFKGWQEDSKSILRVRIAEYPYHSDYRRKPSEVHQVVERTAKVRRFNYVKIDPTEAPSPLCSRCATKAGIDLESLYYEDTNA